MLKANQARLRERAFRIALQQYPNDAHAKVGQALSPANSAAIAAAR